MTYGTLKYVVQGLLTGDNKLPKEDEVVRALLGMAYDHLANKCQVLNLLTLDHSEDILRIGKGDYMVRVPELPNTDSDELDIDNNLGYAAASLVASYISKTKANVHIHRATDAITIHNGKVEEMLDSIKNGSDA